MKSIQLAQVKCLLNQPACIQMCSSCISIILFWPTTKGGNKGDAG